jgi:DNA-binding response OmpR family regulator
MRLLILEDDIQVARGLQEGLVRAGYAVDHVGTPSEADQAMQRENYALAIVDLGLPQEDGLSFIRRMRDQGIPIPMLILTVRDTLDDCVAGLDSGANDFMTKPFRFPELLARVRAALRPRVEDRTPVVRVGQLCMNLRTREVQIGDEWLDLPAREQMVLEKLMTASPKVVAKAALIEALTGGRAELSANAIEVYVTRLRPKLSAHGFNIRNVRGIGYRLEAPAP